MAMTTITWTLLAQVGRSPVEPAPLKISNDLLLLLGAVVVLTLLFLFWAIFLRERKDDLGNWRTRKHHHDSSSDASDGSEHRHRRRRRRREHRPRNPTLAETGGLPPARTEPPPQSNS